MKKPAPSFKLKTGLWDAYDWWSIIFDGGQSRGINTNSTSNNSGSKSKLVAGLLQIFLGSFGVGRFYLGYVGIGIAQILVTWLTCGFGAIWPLIDGIMILTGSVKTDANGNPLSD